MMLETEADYRMQIRWLNWCLARYPTIPRIRLTYNNLREFAAGQAIQRRIDSLQKKYQGGLCG